ncbi:phosphorylase [Geobacter sp. DSM 9736]|uniref:phosphorylase family protein n=1 Tax=Geobacter sp. DSM 9736 TaxID=1277350 RepID=UPI000B5076C0|nr:phosphorylase [Geobacter sp. DSM 9736]SNB46370.1 adenosylhomocysteine nucleosidase [Geobacter sp. DSM 9736]
MAERTIALLAALPEEIRTLIRKAGGKKRKSVSRFPCYELDRYGEIIVVETGMGPINAEEAAKAIAVNLRPHFFINFGFAGAIAPGPAIGDIAVGRRLFIHQNGCLREEEGLTPALSEIAESALVPAAGYKSFAATIVTTAQILDKKMLERSLPADVIDPVIEMETAAVAKVAAEHQIPFLALRGISDAAEEELGFSLDEFTDSNMRIRTRKVLLTIARRPMILPQLIRLGRNSRIAGQNLAEAVLTVLRKL